MLSLHKKHILFPFYNEIDMMFMYKLCQKLDFWTGSLLLRFDFYDTTKNGRECSLAVRKKTEYHTSLFQSFLRAWSYHHYECVWVVYMV